MVVMIPLQIAKIKNINILKIFGGSIGRYSSFFSRFFFLEFFMSNCFVSRLIWSKLLLNVVTDLNLRNVVTDLNLRSAWACANWFLKFFTSFLKAETLDDKSSTLTSLFSFLGDAGSLTGWSSFSCNNLKNKEYYQHIIKLVLNFYLTWKF